MYKTGLGRARRRDRLSSWGGAAVPNNCRLGFAEPSNVVAPNDRTSGSLGLAAVDGGVYFLRGGPSGCMNDMMNSNPPMPNPHGQTLPCQAAKELPPSKATAIPSLTMRGRCVHSSSTVVPRRQTNQIPSCSLTQTSRNLRADQYAQSSSGAISDSSGQRAFFASAATSSAAQIPVQGTQRRPIPCSR